MECWGALNTWNLFKALRHYIAQKVPLVQLHLKDALINHRVSLNLPYNPVIGVLSLTQVCFTSPITANQLFCPRLFGLHIAVSVTNFPGHTWVIWYGLYYPKIRVLKKIFIVKFASYMSLLLQFYCFNVLMIKWLLICYKSCLCMLNSLEIIDFVLNTIMSLIYHKYILNKTDIFESLTSENVTQDYLLQFCKKIIYDNIAL